jgi:DNA-binding CsgD family transcriptional regulator
MRRRSDFVAIIEACYADSSDEGEWLRGLVAATEAACTCHDGVIAYTFDANRPGGFRQGLSAASASITPAAVAEALSLVRRQEPHTLKLFAPYPPANLLSEALRVVPELDWKAVSGTPATVGFADVLGIRGANHDGTGVILALGQARMRRFAPRTRGALGRVARHLAAAHRLRKRLAECRSLPDAVLSPSGKVEHLEPGVAGPAERQALPRAARAMDLARGRLRRTDPERATELWRALVEGKWSVVESVESDGKRLLLARRNELKVARPAHLTAEVRQVVALAASGFSNKQIAYELGLSPSRTSELLVTGLKQLGNISRLELGRWYRP